MTSPTNGCARCGRGHEPHTALRWAHGRTPLTAGQALCPPCHAALPARRALAWVRATPAR